VQRGEPAQARHEPPDGEGSRGRNGQNTNPVLISDALTSKKDAVHSSAHAFEKSPTIDCQFDAAMETPEQSRPEMIFEGPDLMADGTLGESEFVRRPRE